MCVINIHSCSYTCGDYCCHETWQEIEIDNKYVMDENDSNRRKEFQYATMQGELDIILKALPIEVEVNYL